MAEAQQRMLHGKKMVGTRKKALEFRYVAVVSITGASQTTTRTCWLLVSLQHKHFHNINILMIAV